MTHIIDAYLGLAALRQAGYRSTATAVAELVDNSIEAGASEIDIIAISRSIILSQRKSNQVESIAVLDNGDGMTEEIINALAKIPDLKVTSRTSSFYFKII